MKNLLVWILALSFAAPQVSWAQQDKASSPRASQATLTVPRSSQAESGKPGTDPAAQSETRAHARSYQRETRARSHRSGISKKEVVFLGAIAGTSMGIGALAAGGEGVAIGAIAGGWGAYVGHRIWKWVR